MPELRWTLLVLGVLFIAALAWWELRRPRHVRRSELERRPAHGESEPDTLRVHREPTISLPEIRAVPEMRGREPVKDLPIVEVQDDALMGLRFEEDRTPEAVQLEDEHDDDIDEALEQVKKDLGAPPEPEHAHTRIPVALSAEPAPTVEPIVDWPPEDVRKIVALRLVAPGERFPGHALRQALAAEGFLHGKFDIFHKPGPDARAVVSAASLTRPGTFDMESIDLQRFGGLNLFTVLPGPLPARQAFEELLTSARNLNARLQGALQDERGAPLTPGRIVALREDLPAESTEHTP